MTLDEAIKHCEEIASNCDNKECALDHKQLAEWLKELKLSRIIIKLNTSDEKTYPNI